MLFNKRGRKLDWDQREREILKCSRKDLREAMRGKCNVGVVVFAHERKQKLDALCSIYYFPIPKEPTLDCTVHTYKVHK